MCLAWASVRAPAVSGALAQAQPVAVPSPQAEPDADQPGSSMVPDATRLPAIKSPGTSEGAAPPPSSTFDSSFEPALPPEPGRPDTESAKNPDRAPAPTLDGASDVPLALPPAAAGSSSLPGWGWLALIAGVLVAGLVVRAIAASRSARRAPSGGLGGWLAPRCPYCQNPIARPSSRRSKFESWVLRFFLITPVRCLDCRRRYYSLAFFARGSSVQSS